MDSWRTTAVAVVFGMPLEEEQQEDAPGPETGSKTTTEWQVLVQLVDGLQQLQATDVVPQMTALSQELQSQFEHSNSIVQSCP